MAALHSSLLFAAALLAAPATAQPSSEGFNAGDYFAPFMLICLKDYGNADRQVQLAREMQKATKAPMWKLVSEQVGAGKTQLTFQGATVVVDPQNKRSCSVAMQVGEAVSLDAFASGIAKAIGGIRPTKQNDEMVWILKVGGENTPPLLLAASTTSDAGKNSVRLRIQDSGL
jgi:hypothetical protein